MKLTPLYEALIFIEDKGSSTIADLEFLNKAVIRGILGKKEAIKLIERENNRFKISP